MIWHLQALWSNLGTGNSYAAVLEVRKILGTFASAVFIILGWHLNAKNQSADYSLLFFALAMLSWGLPQFSLTTDSGQQEELDLLNSKLKVLNSLCYSTLNNMFFFLAFCFVEHGKPNYRFLIFRYLNIKDDEQYLKRVIYIAVLILTFLVLLWGLAWKIYPDWIIVPLLLDVIISLVAFGWLWHIFSASFQQRFDKASGFVMQQMTAAVMVCAIVAQFINAYGSYYDFKNNEFRFERIAVIFNTFYNLNMIFLIGSLAFSWALEKFSDSKEKAIEKEKIQLLQKLKFEERYRKMQKAAAKRAEFLREDMLHVIRNSLFYLEIDFEKMALGAASSQKSTSASPDEIALRIKIIHQLFYLMHVKKNKSGIPLEEYLQEVLNSVKGSFKWESFEWTNPLPVVGDARGTAAQKIAKILVEFSINAFKYGRRQAELGIHKCQVGGIEYLEFKITDHGDGYVAQSGSSDNLTFGISAINHYLKDLKAQPFEYKNYLEPSGAAFTFSIPLKDILL